MLLLTTNDDFHSYHVPSFIINNSSLFMSMSNLISIKYKYHGHETTCVNLFFHIHVGDALKK
jgi:hypothetical protein